MLNWNIVSSTAVFLGWDPKSDPNGIELGTTGLRLERGSGSHANQWWLKEKTGKKIHAGPLTTVRELQQALQAVRDRR